MGLKFLFTWDIFGEMNTLEKLEAAGKKKENGDALFKDGKYAKASKQYKKAAKCIDYNTLFSEEEIQQSKALKVSCDISNAACKLKLKDYKQAEKLCTKVIKTEAQNAAAYHIRAQAYLQQSVLNPADSDIRNALRIDPNNKDLLQTYKTVREKTKEDYEKNPEIYVARFFNQGFTSHDH